MRNSCFACWSLLLFFVFIVSSIAICKAKINDNFLTCRIGEPNVTKPQQDYRDVSLKHVVMVTGDTKKNLRLVNKTGHWMNSKISEGQQSLI